MLCPVSLAVRTLNRKGGENELTTSLVIGVRGDGERPVVRESIFVGVDAGHRTMIAAAIPLSAFDK